MAAITSDACPSSAAALYINQTCRVAAFTVCVEVEGCVDQLG
jgi:hypothetical protein